MPFGMEVGLGPAHIVLDGDLVPPQKKQASVSQLHQTHDSDHLLHAMHSPPCPNLYVVCSDHSRSAGWTTVNAALGLGRLAL